MHQRTSSQLVHIAQEAIANAVKHSGSSVIKVEFSCRPGRKAEISMRDHGAGKNAAKRSRGGLGLGIMRHRANRIDGVLSIGEHPLGGVRTVETYSARMITKLSLEGMKELRKTPSARATPTDRADTPRNIRSHLRQREPGLHSAEAKSLLFSTQDAPQPHTAGKKKRECKRKSPCCNSAARA